MELHHIVWIPAPVQPKIWWPVRMLQRVMGAEAEPVAADAPVISNSFLGIGSQGVRMPPDGVTWKPLPTRDLPVADRGRNIAQCDVKP